MKILLLPILLFFALNSQSQTLSELWKKYALQELNEVVTLATELEKKEPENIELKLLLGRSYEDLEMPHRALPYLLYVDKHGQSFNQAWARAYLGAIYYQRGAYSESKTYLQKTINSNSTPTVTRFARNKSSLFGFADIYNNFITKESEHIIFHFDPEFVKLDSDLEAFIKDREESFIKINKFFNSILPKKIDLFVWNSRESLTVNTGSKLPFSNPVFCVSQTVFDQTPGHEITHVISHYSNQILHKSAFINEGTAVCFDQNKVNRLQYAQKVINISGLSSIDLKDFWGDSNMDAKVSSAVAGAFIEYIIEKKGKDKFLELFKDQTYENAKKVYGSEYDDIEAEFTKSLFPTVVLTKVEAEQTAVQKLTGEVINAIIEKTNSSDNYYRVLILLNGKPISKFEVEKIEAKKIKNFKVIKSKQEIKQYTAHDLNGIILISTE